MKKYLAFYENEWPANIAELTAVENKPFVGYLVGTKEVKYTVITAPIELPSDNEIWYTSSNGDVVTPNATDVFGANIVSNTYEDGIGTITFDSPVTSIGEKAFFYCSSLNSITIPNGVTSIGSLAFYSCNALSSITIPNSVKSIGSSAFSTCPSLTSIVVDSTNAIYDSRDNCNAIIETTTNTLVVGCQTTIIPESVTSIGSDAFYNCKFLTSITIPNSVTSIGNEAFRNCSSLTSVTIGNSVTSIDGSAFHNCSSLTSITIPNSVTSIGMWAFYYCFALTSITFEGTIEQWNSITKGRDWKYNVPATRVQCSDGQVAL